MEDVARHYRRYTFMKNSRVAEMNAFAYMNILQTYVRFAGICEIISLLWSEERRLFTLARIVMFNQLYFIGIKPAFSEFRLRNKRTVNIEDFAMKM